MTGIDIHPGYDPEPHKIMDTILSEPESFDLLHRLFPGGLRTPMLLEALCPGGWAASPLRLAFHPGPEQCYQETVAMRKNLERLGEMGKAGRKAAGKPDPPPMEPLPSYEEFVAGLEPDTQSDPDEVELARLMGLCLWDVLSDNHEILLPDGRLTHLGSFRGTAGIIADFFNERITEDVMPDFEAFAKLQAMTMEGNTPKLEDFASLGFNMDYCEFYMGTCWIANRTDLGQVYRFIFERLKACGCDWRYSFPRLGVVRFEKPEPKPDADTPEWANYNPSAAFAAEQEKSEKDAEFERLEASLEEGYQESLEDARCRPAPATVQAYHAVFGGWPGGWPPWEHR